jgi:hypothetical protein
MMVPWEEGRASLLFVEKYNGEDGMQSTDESH